uniref:Thioredoxin domain-containing protein 17 n=1 Tax=Monodon monoceros TaxID=40151 RepID=A0A8C6BBD4_MONMO
MARYEEVSVSGYEEFTQVVEQHSGKTIFAYFSVFIYCQGGEKPYWKDPNNDFRKKLELTAVPTLLKYGTPQKLVESECLQADLVGMLFSED